MSEQDHKISSMLGLISTMAGELQFFRSKLSSKQEEEEEEEEEVEVGRVEEVKEKIILDPNNLIAGSILISVSDDESEEDEEDEEAEDEEEEDDDEDEEEEEDDESDEETDEEVDLEDIIEFDQPILNLEDFTEDNNIKSIHLEEPIDLNFTNNEHEHEHEHEHEQMDELLTSDLKSISITDLEEPNKKQEYKKMSINKLREFVVEKGVITDASKLKKQDLLKLLGDE